MHNTLKFISKKELNELRTKTSEEFFKVIIDGEKISTWVDYWNAISKAFSFPDLPSYMEPDYHSYYDLMTDLSWLKKESIILVIENAEAFLKSDLKLKNDIIKDFREYLLPFWEKEVLKTVVDGKKKNFCVYFIINDEVTTNFNSVDSYKI